MRIVQVDVRRWPATMHRCVDGVLLGEDRYGVWVGVPAGARIQTRDSTYGVESPYVYVVPRGEWWIGRHFSDGGWKLDVATPFEWTGDRGTGIDLALDVRRLDGTVWIEDEDEFEDDLHRGVLPMRLAEPARRTAAHLYEALRADREPYATIGSQWLRVLQGQ